MKNFKQGLLEIRVNKENDTHVTMDWVGQSDERNPAATLDPYLETIIDDLKGVDLHIEFSHLEYMNSSTVQPIILFFKKLNNAEIKTQVTYNSDLKWQAATFKALKSFSSLLNHIRVVAR